MNKNTKLEDVKLWQLTSEIAERIYGLLDSFPEEEKWGMQSKLRARAFDVSSDIAEATGAIDPRDIKWQLAMARRSLFGLKNALRLAHKAGYLEIQPELMVKIDKATELVDLGITQATHDIPLWFREMDSPIKDGKKMKYDYFIAGRWRNRDAINEIVKQIRATGKTVHSFTENAYEGDGITFDPSPEADPEAMIRTTENRADWRTNPTFRKIFEADMQAQREAEAFVLVFPAGLAAHMEFGAAYGMGKPCFAIGQPEKTETLYLMFDEVYPTVQAFIKAQIGVAV